MFYLILQIAFILALATLTGLGAGWWLRGKTGEVTSSIRETAPEDPFDARFRLEQCHRDNATLRRDLKESEELAEKLQHRLENTSSSDADVLERLEAYETRVQALMEDLQMRDDTIAVLERELEEARTRNA
ncbi:MAG: hypothetical protein RI964_1190 [Pseudomonadota bacterium]|jgi:septal ring factor EnvC (AmiA/AmiB activator)